MRQFAPAAQLSGRYFRWLEPDEERLLKILLGLIGCRSQLTNGARTWRARRFPFVSSAEEPTSMAGVAGVSPRNKLLQSRTNERPTDRRYSLAGLNKACQTVSTDAAQFRANTVTVDLDRRQRFLGSAGVGE